MGQCPSPSFCFMIDMIMNNSHLYKQIKYKAIKEMKEKAKVKGYFDKSQ